MISTSRFILSNTSVRKSLTTSSGVDFFATLIIKDLKERGYRCNITTHNVPTNKSKCDRILACQNDIKGIASENGTYRIYFKNKSLLTKYPQYIQALTQLNNWNQNPSAQRKQHDDFPDSLAGMITNVLGGRITGRASSNISLDKYGL